MIRRLLLICGALACLTVTPLDADTSNAPATTFAIDLDALEYRDTPFKGIRTAAVFGHRAKSGVYATHAVLEAGSIVPPHTHPNTLTTWVTSGTAYVGTGTVFDEAKLIAYPAGTFFVTPAGSPHFIYAKDGPFSVLDHGAGPSGFLLVKPD